MDTSLGFTAHMAIWDSNINNSTDQKTERLYRADKETGEVRVQDLQGHLDHSLIYTVKLSDSPAGAMEFSKALSHASRPKSLLIIPISKSPRRHKTPPLESLHSIIWSRPDSASCANPRRRQQRQPRMQYIIILHTTPQAMGSDHPVKFSIPLEM